MRTGDGLVALLGAMLAFGAVAVGFEDGTNWAVVATMATAAAGLFLVAAFRVLVTPRILLVGDPDGPSGGRLQVMTEALEEDGFAVRSCAGPTHGGCPVLDGKPCPVGGLLSGVVVYHPADYTGPVPNCGRALHLPELTIEADSDREPEVARDTALVGAARGPETAVRALHAIVA